MSASREKQKRREIEPGTDPKQVKAQQEKKANRKKAWIYGAIAAAFVIVFIVLMLLNSNSYMEHKTAATVGDQNVSVVDFDYYFRGEVNTYASYFGDNWSTYASYFSSDSFVTSALSGIQQTYSLYDEAQKAGYTLTEEDRQAIEQTISYYAAYAQMSGYGSTDSFIAANFGKGCSEETYRAWMEKQYIAQGYAQQQLDSYTYTDEELQAYYDENSNDFDLVTYRTFFISSTAAEDQTEEDAKAEALEKAQSMADAANGNLEGFNDLCVQNASSDDVAANYADDPDYSLASEYTYSQVAADCAEWLFDAARAAGETTVIETDSGCYVLGFVERSAPDYSMVNVRHILIRVEDTTDEAAMAEAKARAESLLDEWSAGEATEDSFAQLATDNSDDSSASDGGLIENIYKGQMVEAFEDWCFDSSRQAGDTGIVETEYGYHVMYFSGTGENYLTYSEDQALRNRDYNTWYSEISADYTTATVDSGLKHCNLTVQ